MGFFLLPNIRGGGRIENYAGSGGKECLQERPILSCLAGYGPELNDMSNLHNIFISLFIYFIFY